MTSAISGPEDQALIAEQPSSAANASSHKIHAVNHSEMVTKSLADSVLPEEYPSTGHTQTNSTTVATSLEASLLDERALLACIVRTIPAGGRIRISSTVCNS